MTTTTTAKKSPQFIKSFFQLQRLRTTAVKLISNQWQRIIKDQLLRRKKAVVIHCRHTLQTKSAKTSAHTFIFRWEMNKERTRRAIQRQSRNWGSIFSCFISPLSGAYMCQDKGSTWSTAQGNSFQGLQQLSLKTACSFSQAPSAHTNPQTELMKGNFWTWNCLN